MHSAEYTSEHSTTFVKTPRPFIAFRPNSRKMLRILASRASAHGFSRPARSTYCAVRAVSGQQPAEKPKRSESSPRRSVSSPRAPAKAAKAEAKPKALRAPSAYNLYVKSKFGEVRMQSTWGTREGASDTTMAPTLYRKQLGSRSDALYLYWMLLCCPSYRRSRRSNPS